jgi:hypothetical protein
MIGEPHTDSLSRSSRILRRKMLCGDIAE